MKILAIRFRAFVLLFVLQLVFLITTKATIRSRNVLYVYIKSNEVLLINHKACSVDSISFLVTEFISNPLNNPNYGEKKMLFVENIGMFPISRSIISIQCDRNTSYDCYLRVNNEVEKVYNTLRNKLSIKIFGKPYRELELKYKKSINECYPKRISEAEPNYIRKDGKLIRNNFNYYM